VSNKDSRVPKWYFGGVASAAAACITHPLDTMKVYYQTTGTLPGKQTLVATTVRVIKLHGLLSLYNGISASILRQLTYSTTRFAIYELLKQRLVSGSSGDELIPLYQRTIIASLSGAAGGLVGVPADVVNVRMQNDIKFPNDLKRNYRNAFHGLYCVYKTEGVNGLFKGSSMAISRSVLVSIGQLAMYDTYKDGCIRWLNMKGDEVKTHVVASIFTSITCTALTQPLDVLKTRMMNSSRRPRLSTTTAIVDVFRQAGVLGFFKGFECALLRLVPHTVLVFICYEQLRIRYGIDKVVVSNSAGSS